MKKAIIVLLIFAGILAINVWLLRDQYGRPSAGSASEEGAPSPAKPEVVKAEAAPEKPGAAEAVGVAEAQPAPASPKPAAPDEPEAVDETPDAPSEDENIEDMLFPKLKDREAYPVPADFAMANPIWAAAHAAAVALSGIDPARFDEVVATVNGKPIRYRELLEEVVMRFGEKFVEEYRNDLIILREITGAGIEVSEEEMKLGEAEFWDQLQRQGVRNEDELRRKFKWTPEFLRRKVFLNEGGKKLFAGDMGGEDAEKTEALFLQLWLSEIIQRYPVKSIYAAGGEDLPEGVLARVGDLDIRALDVAPYLLPNLKDFHFSMALDSLVEWRAVRDALRARNIEVTPEELQKLADTERAKYAGSLFDWETMLQIGETNVPMEMRKFVTWIAYDRLFGAPKAEEVREHFERYPVYFCRGAVAACEIKTLALDPDTGEIKGPDAWDRARDRILEATAELEAGKPFQSLVMRFSEDPATKKYDNATLFNGKTQRVAGSIGIFPIKNGRMANEIASAAFVVPKGEWIGPVRSREGYHLLYLLDTKAPRDVRYDEEPYNDINENGAFDVGEPYVDENKDGNWNGSQYDNAYEDFEGERVRVWVEDLVSEAKIEKRPVVFR